MFAIVAISGKQYKVSPGDIVEVDKISGKPGEKISFNHVLLIADDKKSIIGNPTVKKATITAKIIGPQQGEKINVRRFKSKVRYRRSIGFRAKLTKLEILSITKA